MIGNIAMRNVLNFMDLIFYYAMLFDNENGKKFSLRI